MTANNENRRQVLYWRLLARVFNTEEQATLESASVAVVDDLGLPTALLDPSVSVDNLVQRFPDLADEFDHLFDHDSSSEEDGSAQVRRAALISKLLLNVFATGSGDVSASQLAAWQKDAGWFKQALGGGGGRNGQGEGQQGDEQEGSGQGRGLGTGGGGRGIDDAELNKAPANLEGDPGRRMRLREGLSNPSPAPPPKPSTSPLRELLRG